MCRYMINIPYVSSYKDYFATGKKENFTAAFECAVPTKKSIRRDFSLQLPALPDGEQKNARHNTRFWGPKRQKNILSQKIFKRADVITPNSYKMSLRRILRAVTTSKKDRAVISPKKQRYHKVGSEIQKKEDGTVSKKYLFFN